MSEPAGTPSTEAPRPRAREFGVIVGVLDPGPLDAITDVAGVEVGQVTLVEGDSIRTGVTAILPHGDNVFLHKVPAAIEVANGFGKLTGSTQVRELGTLETPVVLTNTLSVGAAVEGVVAWVLAQPGDEGVRSVNAVVAETNDARLNDIRRMAVRPEHVRRAIESAKGGPVEEGAVGAGTGTVAFGFKGGIGTASRRLPPRLGGYTVGVLAQTNFGGLLTIDGRRVGERLEPLPFGLDAEASRRKAGRADVDGSCVLVVATDAPVLSRALGRIARRALAGIWLTGGIGSHGSGDYAIAFSTAAAVRMDYVEKPAEPPVPRKLEALPDEALSPLFMAATEAAQEAILNSLFKARTTTGYRGKTVEALPLDRVRAILAAPPGG